MVKTYILAPDYSTAPPPDGPVQLGDLLTDLSELVPLNDKDRVPVPPAFPPDYKYDFKATRSTLLSGNLGVWAQTAAIFGIGVGAGWAYEAADTDVISFQVVETRCFNPTADYVRLVMAAGPVRSYMASAGGSAAVYMITGLKIGHGAAVETSYSREKGIKLKLGFTHPGVPVEGGPEGGVRSKRVEGMSFEGSTDFVIAFRVRKITYKKGVLHAMVHNKGATLLDGTEGEAKRKEPELEFEEEAGLEDAQLDSEMDLKAVEGDENDDKDESLWIVPEVAQLNG
ncbi:major facilitator superfamily MFS-1 [Purpureocillium lilacinum]|uniref:Major facilitator superfamily MFS-1 n=1 Tax=Purpureocillium lilacinum TaxID=33203 RepID=A0A179EZB9_PURLI|nr:major facilitator superfamily MFS-1 [Purpureocillium lilacinum]OAQ58350.1 major facilitator superfamily MFS-1 [Purpureocillium lilacinum]